MKLFTKTLFLFILSFNLIAANTQLNCNFTAASGNLIYSGVNSSSNYTLYILNVEDFSATFFGNFDDGVINYALHQDSILNFISSSSTGFLGSSGQIPEYISQLFCQPFFISAIHGLDLDGDGIIDDLGSNCNTVFTSRPIYILPYFYIDYTQDLNLSNGSYQDGSILYVIQANNLSCMDTVPINLTVNGNSGFYLDSIYTYQDPITGNSALPFGEHNLYLEIENLDGSIFVIDLIVNISCGFCAIQLVNFEGHSTENGNLLEWATQSELENDHFTVYKSDNGTDFKSIAQIQGSGTSSKTKNYSFLDETENTSSAISYYKLSEVDFSGYENEIGIISIENNTITNFDATFEIENLIVNKKKLTCTVLSENDGGLLFEVFSMHGKLIVRKNATLNKGANSCTFSLDELSQQIYILKFKKDGLQFTKKISIY